MSSKRVFLSYKDDADQTVSGYVDLIEQNLSYIKFRTAQNVITISYNRLLKLKEQNDSS